VHKRPITSFVHGEGRRFSTAGSPNYDSLINVSQVLHGTDGSPRFFLSSEGSPRVILLPPHILTTSRPHSSSLTSLSVGTRLESFQFTTCTTRNGKVTGARVGPTPTLKSTPFACTPSMDSLRPFQVDHISSQWCAQLYEHRLEQWIKQISVLWCTPRTYLQIFDQCLSTQIQHILSVTSALY